MRRGLFLLVGLLSLPTLRAAPAAQNANVTFAGGLCRALGTGGYELALSDGQQLVVNPTWVNPGWTFKTVSNVKRSANVKDGKLTLTFEATAPVGFETQDSQPMLIIVNGDGADYPDGLFRLDDSHVASLANDNVWGYGSHFELDALRLRFFLDGDRSVSFWNNPETKVWNIRIPTTGEVRRDGSTRYKGKLALAVSDVSIAKPLDLVVAEQKRVQYRRVLVPPQETGFDPMRWLAVCDNPNTTNAEFVRLERLMDLRSHLYTLADRLRHRAADDDTARGQVAAAYVALNAMDADTAQQAIAALDVRMGELDGKDADRRPLSDFSPYSWIKSFTQWGYLHSPDGHGPFEPTPWNLAWEDGFRCNVDQDARVAAVRTTDGRNFCETRYLASMADVSFERDWVSTRWRFADGKTVTFSLLTPVVDVDGVTALKLGGFSVAPDSLQLIDGQGRERWITLAGETAIDPDDVGRPWLWLNIPYDRGLILLPEARPTAVSWIDGVLTITFARQGYVGLVRPPANLSSSEFPEVAEFFARTSAAYPVACHEAVDGRTCTWRYAFRERTNDWATEATRLAPVPPLVGLAGLRCTGEKTFAYPTKWGPMRYVPGGSAVCELPSDTPQEPKAFCGVNSSIWEPIESELAVVTNGTMGVRLLTTRDKTVEESCRRFEEVLAVYRQYGIKVLMDAHNSVYDVWWQDGLTDCDDFVAMWSALSQVGAKYKDVVVGYDLYNEPGLGAGSAELWRPVCTRAAEAILANHPEAKIYTPGLADGNPNGLVGLRPLDLGNAREVMTYHFYLPHAFTHQKSVTLDEGGDTCVFYPAWAYPTDWSAGNHFAGTTVDWYDKWSLGALLLPAVEHYAKYGIAQHVGEFSVIGYANGRSPRSACLWTKDAAALFDHIGASWHLWNGGFGLGNEDVRDWFFSRMRGNQAEEKNEENGSGKDEPSEPPEQPKGELLYYFPLEGTVENVGGTRGSRDLMVGANLCWDDDGWTGSPFGTKALRSSSDETKVYNADGLVSAGSRWTLSFWVNLSREAWGWKDACGFQIGENVFRVEKTDAPALQLYGAGEYLRDADGNEKPIVCGTGWVNVSLVCGTDLKSVDVYVDGAYHATICVANADCLKGFYFSAYGFRADPTWSQIFVDEVSIWDGALTADQLAQLAKNPATKVVRPSRPFVLIISSCSF